ncbi:MAG: manganese efflux pump MntP family protein [Oscillospiraceae bacterium]|nr:manganese efflux pump MntP family protein [Oscillospiraceae bacterium]
MSLPELLLLALGLSMDTFAVAICAGLGLAKVNFLNMLIIGGYFGLFQAAMPLVGYLLAARFTVWVNAVDHWIAFALLGFIGVRMIISSQKKEDRCAPCVSCETCRVIPAFSVSLRSMVPLALATSIDAAAVGISFAFLEVDIIPAISYIGIVTLIVAIAGVKVGQAFGVRFRKKAELVGGAILVLLGGRIFLDGVGVL